MSLDFDPECGVLSSASSLEDLANAAEMHSKELRRQTRRSATPTVSHLAVMPRLEELPSANEACLATPICPRCSNQDPRTFIIEDALFTNREELPLTVSMGELSRTLTKSLIMCFACMTKFDYCSETNVFLGIYRMNCAFSTKRYVMRVCGE